MIKNHIGGEWVESHSQTSTPVTNPATGEELGQCPVGSESDVRDAVRAATAAFKTWRQTPAIDRVQCLFRLKALMEENAEHLALTITKENGKTLVEARGSVRRAIQMVETACGIPTMMMGDAFEDIAGGIDCIAVRRPMGVFAAVTPFNFPAMVAFWFWPFAVACGNTFVLKPSERVPLTQIEIFKLIEKAGFPKGVMNLVHGGKDVVNALCDDPGIQGVSFVGSTPVAKHVYTRGTSVGKRVQALGGAKNFMVVLPDAVMDKAVSVALESIIGCAGERCLAGSVVLCVGDETYREVSERMSVKVKEVMIGDGASKNTAMGPLISQAAKDRVKELIQSAANEGAKILVDGRAGVDQMKGYFLKPSLIADVRRDMRVAREEIFGPVVCLAKVETLDEAIEWLNSSNFANTTTLFTTNGAAARKFSYEVEPSMIGINIGVPAPMAFFSFGGTKDSFYGDIKAHGMASVDFYTDKKVTVQKWLKDSSIW